MAEEAILGYLENHEEISDSGEFAAERGIDHAEIVNVIKSLHGFRFVDTQDIKRETWVLTEEGKKYAAEGSPEVQLFLAVPAEGSISKDELQKKLDSGIFKIGCSQAGKNKWVEMGKHISRKVQHVEDKVKDLLLRIQDAKAIDKDDINSLKARKLIVLQTWKGYSVRKGPNYAPKRKKPATDLTRENLQRGDWKELEFKEYNFSAKGPPPECGHLHPLNKVKDRLKDIFRQLNFEEMPTNRYVESSFWNFDALFQPQQHPARDSHDTFFLQVPSTTRQLPEDYVEQVKEVHESGVMDQEGLVCDRGLTLSHLIGILEDFFSRLGMSKLRFKPAYNPYTEPSMEIFRPEMLRPMGFPEDVSVIAWGLSLERPTMILYGIDNIRDLFGHKVDLTLMKRNPLCLIGIR
ncbi:hypothetical protein GH714_008827 [Hevea brasiliensis]|uniref:Phenylalanyl-tRNA synthetase domain-containing protein n=1 Tax=Hevea brasiliensis TaxID=3981 RepID=A0A6A6M1V6_HEVBR|nr:hypothetical protein GH714_008827 [Hevea brasiliensis]